jgi:hypothetical protein
MSPFLFFLGIRTEFFSAAGGGFLLSLSETTNRTRILISFVIKAQATSLAPPLPNERLMSDGLIVYQFGARMRGSLGRSLVERHCRKSGWLGNSKSGEREESRAASSRALALGQKKI